MQTVLLVGGDARTKYLAKFLSDRNFSTYCLFADAASAAQSAQTALAGQYDILLLPLPASKDGRSVFCPFAKQPLPFETLVRLTRSNALVLGGMLPTRLTELYLQNNVQTAEYCDELLLLKNAKLTAKGALQILREHEISLPTASVLTVGYGRIAKAFCRLCRQAGCLPTVAVRRAEALFEARADGCNALPLADLPAVVGHFDVVCNTVPAPVLPESVLARTGKGALLVELASAPFGIDFAAAERLQRHTVKASGLPGRYFPQAAAEAIGEAVLRCMQ